MSQSYLCGHRVCKRELQPAQPVLPWTSHFCSREHAAAALENVVIRLNRNAREFAALRQRAGGLILGTMPAEEAFEYLRDAERRIAEVRGLLGPAR